MHRSTRYRCLLIALCAVLFGCTWMDHFSNRSVLEDANRSGFVVARVGYGYPKGLELQYSDGVEHRLRLACCSVAEGVSISRGRIAVVDLTEAPSTSALLKIPVLWPSRIGPVVLMNAKGEIVDRSEVQVYAEHIAISPDESQFAFTANVGFSLWMAAFRGSEIRQLLEPPKMTAGAQMQEDTHERSSIDWSPDGRSLLFAGIDGIQIIDVQTGISKKIGNGGRPRWSPSGGSITYVTPLGQVILLDLATNKSKVIDRWHRVIGPAEWSPDEKLLLVQEAANITFGKYWMYRIADGAWMPLEGVQTGGLPAAWMKMQP